MARKLKTEPVSDDPIVELDTATTEDTPNPILEKIIANPIVVIKEPETFPELLRVMRAELDSLNADPTTSKGRAALVSLSYKVTRTKTAIAASVTEATRGWREQIDELNAKRREVLPQLEALADEIRAPVDAWEAEQKRLDEIVDTELNLLDDALRVTIADTVSSLEAKLERLRGKTFDEATFRKSLGLAESKRDRAIEAIEAALPGMRQAEKDRAELEELRRAATERKQREEAEKAETERKAREEMRAEAERKAKAEREAAETERLAQAEKRAAEKARAEADAEAERQRQAEAREAQRRIDEANERARKAEEGRIRELMAFEQREKDRLAEEARVKRAADAKAEAERKAEERRQANRAHQGRVMKAAKEALMADEAFVAVFAGSAECKAEIERAAKAVIIAIQAGRIPAVTINF